MSEPLAVLLADIEQRMRKWLSDGPEVWEPQEHIIQWADDLASVIRGIEDQPSAERCADGFICEQHPERAWPHDDCAGPGMLCPPMQAREHYWLAFTSASPSLVSCQREEETEDTRVDGERRAAGPAGSTAPSNEVPPTWRE